MGPQDCRPDATALARGRAGGRIRSLGYPDVFYLRLPPLFFGGEAAQIGHAEASSAPRR